MGFLLILKNDVHKMRSGKIPGWLDLTVITNVLVKLLTNIVYNVSRT